MMKTNFKTFCENFSKIGQEINSIYEFGKKMWKTSRDEQYVHLV